MHDASAKAFDRRDWDAIRDSQKFRHMSSSPSMVHRVMPLRVASAWHDVVVASVALRCAVRSGSARLRLRWSDVVGVGPQAWRLPCGKRKTLKKGSFQVWKGGCDAHGPLKKAPSFAGAVWSACKVRSTRTRTRTRMNWGVPHPWPPAPVRRPPPPPHPHPQCPVAPHPWITRTRRHPHPYAPFVLGSPFFLRVRVRVV